jgi:putative Mg2+ transporter-C (MgtC) family protein
MEIESGEILLRIGLAALCGAALGFEREVSDQAAGFRTHILVTLGACLFTLVGIHAAAEFSVEGAKVRVDPTRIAAQVVTGIGFLGAGAIIQQGVNVRGLTTAASLWVTAAIGTAVGLGFYSGALLTTAFAIAALLFLKPIKNRVGRRIEQRKKPEPHEPF